MTEKLDGRRVRGEVRKQQLIDAALAVLGRDDLAGLTDGGGCRRGRCPLASASYHFDGIKQLVEAALQPVTDDLITTLPTDAKDRTVAHLAQLLADR